MAPTAPGDLAVAVTCDTQLPSQRSPAFLRKRERRRVSPRYADKILYILTSLDQAENPDDMDLLGLGLHPLHGDLAGYWTVTVSANWRIGFRFTDKNVCDVDLIDYH